MNEEIYLYDDEIEKNIWCISPIDDKSFMIKTGKLGDKLVSKIMKFRAKNEDRNYIQYYELIRKKRLEGYRCINEQYLVSDEFKAFNKLKNKLKKSGFSKKTWLPKTSNLDGSIISSKFSGKPYLLKNEDYPKCKLCNQCLQLFVQLNLSELPEEKRIFGTGLLQLFFCTNKENGCYVSEESYQNYPPHQLLRVIDISSDFNDNFILPENNFPPKLVIEWKYIGLEYPYNPFDFTEGKNVSFGIEDESDEFYMIDNNIHHIISGEKIGGYPLFIQSEYYPICKDCKKEMEIILQIGSDMNIPFMFGDGGVGHIFICPEHKSNTHFYWSCG